MSSWSRLSGSSCCKHPPLRLKGILHDSSNQQQKASTPALAIDTGTIMQLVTLTLCRPDEMSWIKRARNKHPVSQYGVNEGLFENSIFDQVPAEAHIGVSRAKPRWHWGSFHCGSSRSRRPSLLFGVRCCRGTTEPAIYWLSTLLTRTTILRVKSLSIPKRTASRERAHGAADIGENYHGSRPGSIPRAILPKPLCAGGQQTRLLSLPAASPAP